MYKAFSNYQYYNTMMFQLQKNSKNLILEPLSCILKLILLQYKEKGTKISISNKYGLALTLKEQKKFDEAKKIARELIKENPTNLIFQTNILEIYLAEENSLEAISLGKDLLKIHTNNYFISYYLSKAYILNGDPDKAEELLINLSKINPEDPFVWYELAEAQGLSGNIIGLHRSRAEYFVLTGRYDSAIYQLREGLKLSKNFFEIRESIINKLEQIYQTKRALKDLT